ncbi:hypothetical protein [Lawsonibacter sp.]|uniref:hypothetical protein n=1 Tax=Lawsonibacter sp. TaxID=2185275 RepID=UPI002590ECD4|nr:hypothetical protein [Lawsonibacter sp.]MCI6399317.1 hypothetical protein [Lawsonibacter sp.]MDY2976642.1 hypothetical protein [Oscillospiraceae bacterium]
MEIERRWRVRSWPSGTPAAVLTMEQGYFSTRPAIRIRAEAFSEGGTRYVLCFKGKGGLCREEIELELDAERYRRLQGMLEHPMICKEQRRYPLPGGLTLEVNQVDRDRESGFFYAEVEFSDVQAARAWMPPEPLRAYLADEVTGQPGQSMAAYWERTRSSLL